MFYATRRATSSKRCRKRRDVEKEKGQPAETAVVCISLSIVSTTMLYYKRLEPEAFAILSAIRAGKTIANACAVGVGAEANASACQLVCTSQKLV